MFNRESFIQLLRYGLVGIASNSVGFLVYLIFTYFGATPKITMSLLYMVGVTIGYFGNSKLTFEHQGSVLGTGLKYILAHVFGYIVNLTILIIMVDKLGYPHQWVQAAAIFVVAGFLFMIFKFFVFTEKGLLSWGSK